MRVSFGAYLCRLDDIKSLGLVCYIAVERTASFWAEKNKHSTNVPWKWWYAKHSPGRACYFVCFVPLLTYYIKKWSTNINSCCCFLFSVITPSVLGQLAPLWLANPSHCATLPSPSCHLSPSSLITLTLPLSLNQRLTAASPSIQPLATNTPVKAANLKAHPIAVDIATRVKQHRWGNGCLNQNKSCLKALCVKKLMEQRLLPILTSTTMEDPEAD